ncbi:2-O-methyltransferase NoeI [Rubripirellula tenax]|uniref:2-O-methyltransferase NoeI n=2 Tax=Rubripirellula tenax TaxID=2528015 RepID=A0A5C6EJW4_9BACT|nr:2-O-methyltransferase NoeI [Rubripirellula tenax]
MRIVEHSRSPFESLSKASRYVPGQAMIRGKRFQYVDEASFRASYREIFIDQIYDFESSSDEPRILDLGSNTGLSAIYFKQRFPRSRLTCVEADETLLEVLRSNLVSFGYEDTEVLHRAVCDREGTVVFNREGSDAGRLSRGANDATSESTEVEAMTLDGLLCEPVDFLKMDIEGAEVDVLSKSTLLRNVSQLFVEFHSFSNSEQRLSELLLSLENAGFRYYIKTQFCSSKPLLEERHQLGMDLQLNIWCNRNEPTS